MSLLYYPRQSIECAKLFYYKKKSVHTFGCITKSIMQMVIFSVIQTEGKLAQRFFCRCLH